MILTIQCFIRKGNHMNNLVNDPRDVYPSEFLEKLYDAVGLAYTFISKASKLMNTSDAPIDNLYEDVEDAHLEVSRLYEYLCYITEKEMIKENKVESKNTP